MNPPRDRQLAADLWVFERPLRLAIGEVGTRMTVIRLTGGGLWLHSPVRLDGRTRAALGALGPVVAVVAPNKLHHFFFGEYAAVYPQARFHAAPGLREKRPPLRVDAVLGDSAPDEWKADMTQLLVAGAPMMNEVVFCHRASRTLILTDLAHNVPVGYAGARLFYRLVGAPGRFGPHRLARLLIRDRRATAAAVRRMLEWDFERVIMAHGAVLEHGGRERVAAAFAFLDRL